MRHLSKSKILNKIEQRERIEERENYTFRLKKEMMRKFKQQCKTKKVSMASVLEELVIHFVKEN